jgi:peptidoglycan-associated lipoprotein
MKNLRYVMVILFTLSLAACGGGAAVKSEAPAEEQGAAGASGAGVETGVAGGAGAEGEALGGGRQVAMAAPRPEKMRVLFEFDSSAIDSESRAIIEAHAAYLVANPGVMLRLQGHADERGTREYNLALGERRGVSVERMLRVLGVSLERLTTISYGEENPMAMGHNETAWRLNRRVEFAY